MFANAYGVEHLREWSRIDVGDYEYDHGEKFNIYDLTAFPHFLQVLKLGQKYPQHAVAHLTFNWIDCNPIPTSSLRSHLGDYLRDSILRRHTAAKMLGGYDQAHAKAQVFELCFLDDIRWVFQWDRKYDVVFDDCLRYLTERFPTKEFLIVS